jgi:hypothetical protein
MLALSCWVAFYAWHLVVFRTKPLHSQLSGKQRRPCSESIAAGKHPHTFLTKLPVNKQEPNTSITMQPLKQCMWGSNRLSSVVFRASEEIFPQWRQSETSSNAWML